MDKDIIDKSIKSRIELLKLYVILIIALGTGIGSLLLQKEYGATVFILLALGIVWFIVLIGFLIRTFLDVIKLLKFLENGSI